MQPDDSVIASVGLSVFEIRNGKARKLFTVQGAFPERRKTSTDSYSFIDQPLKLPDGGSQSILSMLLKA